jgi:beta-N-acetylhexosaminidase
MTIQVSHAVLCGQLIVGGFEGEELSPAFARALASGKRGGAILFKRNLPTVEHARALCSEIVRASRADLPPFVSVDEEGGRVSRLGSPVLRLPPMRRLGRAGNHELLEKIGRVLGAQLAAIGFNLDFAPVLDVDTNPKNPVIGDRAFGADPETVSMAALAFYQGLSKYVLGCGKHFPGHGDTLVDSHLGLPIIEHDRERLSKVELVPFVAAARANMDAFMTAHVVVKALDATYPATLSPAISTGIARKEVGFEGVLFSDDLEMRAVADNYSVEESAILAIEAGCDALLICKSEEMQERALEALVRMAESDAGFLERCREAFDRCIKARQRRPPRPIQDDDEWRSRMALSRTIEKRIEEEIPA